MLVKKLQHYNIRTTRFDETVDFYTEVLGLRSARPPQAPDSAPPSWLYDDADEPIVHLLKIDPADPEGDYATRSSFRGGIDERHPPAFSGSGSIDHVALECEGWDQMKARLDQHAVPYWENDVPRMNLRQLFITDPNGVTLELNFQGP